MKINTITKVMAATVAAGAVTLSAVGFGLMVLEPTQRGRR